ncbi:hypothetical protein QJS66_06860 [Kocuria rhizophila]|nr:hypothetical protein QJS66_06860 [Kocuria rhizophila]
MALGLAALLTALLVWVRPRGRRRSRLGVAGVSPSGRRARVRGTSQKWLPGHRGVDLSAPPGSSLRSPAGVVSFSGVVVDREVPRSTAETGGSPRWSRSAPRYAVVGVWNGGRWWPALAAPGHGPRGGNVRFGCPGAREYVNR